MTRVVGVVLAVAMLFVPAVSSILQAADPASPIRHAVDIRLDPESRQITITDVITVSGRSEIHFRLAHWMTIKSLLLDRRPIPIPATPETWLTNLPDRGRHQIALSLQGTVPAQRAGRRNGLAQGAVMGPDGGYFFEGAGWIPDTGDDRVSYRLRVEVPVPYRAVATGHLGEETINRTTYSATFSTSYPAAPPALFVGPYDVRERRHADIRIRTYFHHDLADLSEIYLRDSARYLSRFQTEIGPYPYDDFHVISAPIPVGLGFPNLTYMGRRILPLPFIRDRSLAHEVLHNWWGNGITVDYPTGNWAEGLTTYMADYALAAEKDADGGQRMRLGWLRDYAALPADRDAPVTRFTAKHDAAAQVIGYNKVAFIFHMLRRELGDAAFAKALRQFWQQHQGSRAGWMDLRRVFESASGRELSWFFDQWLDRTGAPHLTLSKARTEARTNGKGYRVHVTIRQHPPAYRLTIPIVVETRAGLRHKHIATDGLETVANLELDAQPIGLRIDPAHDLFRRLLPGETPPILRDVTLASNVVTIVATENKAMSEVALQLAKRLLDTPVRVQPIESATLGAAPLLIIGATPEVVAFLARHGLPGMPDRLADRGTSRVWTATWRNNYPIMVVTADNSKALQALLRPLPHYGSRSYLVFDGRQAIDKGIWPATGSPLNHRFN